MKEVEQWNLLVIVKQLENLNFIGPQELITFFQM
jgi:hypothetical protein